jgi:hypothetical protein
VIVDNRKQGIVGKDLVWRLDHAHALSVVRPKDRRKKVSEVRRVRSMVCMNVHWTALAYGHVHHARRCGAMSNRTCGRRGGVRLAANNRLFARVCDDNHFAASADILSVSVGFNGGELEEDEECRRYCQASC